MDYAGIQNKLNYGRGKEAKVLGPPFNVYRLNSSSTGAVIAPSNKIATNISARRKKLKTGDASFETDIGPGTYWYEIIADLTQFRVGDVFVLNDPVYGAGFTSVGFDTLEFEAFAMAGERPTTKAVAGRIDRNITVFRPNFGPDSGGYGKQTLDNDFPIVLNTGTFSLGAVGDTPAQIPAGFMALARPSGGPMFPETPNMTEHTQWRCYVPPLPGFTFREGDRIIAPDESRYVVVHPYRQEAGLVGSQLLMRREVAQP
jgi:hypothetical protein